MFSKKGITNINQCVIISRVYFRSRFNIVENNEVGEMEPGSTTVLCATVHFLHFTKNHCYNNKLYKQKCNERDVRNLASISPAANIL